MLTEIIYHSRPQRKQFKLAGIGSGMTWNKRWTRSLSIMYVTFDPFKSRVLRWRSEKRHI